MEESLSSKKESLDEKIIKIETSIEKYWFCSEMKSRCEENKKCLAYRSNKTQQAYDYKRIHKK